MNATQDELNALLTELLRRKGEKLSEHNDDELRVENFVLTETATISLLHEPRNGDTTIMLCMEK